jgi:hypothetical protein
MQTWPDENKGADEHGTIEVAREVSALDFGK